jgi:hypothetical protein
MVSWRTPDTVASFAEDSEGIRQPSPIIGSNPDLPHAVNLGGLWARSVIYRIADSPQAIF